MLHRVNSRSQFGLGNDGGNTNDGHRGEAVETKSNAARPLLTRGGGFSQASREGSFAGIGRGAATVRGGNATAKTFSWVKKCDSDSMPGEGIDRGPPTMKRQQSAGNLQRGNSARNLQGMGGGASVGGMFGQLARQSSMRSMGSSLEDSASLPASLMQKVMKGGLR